MRLWQRKGDSFREILTLQAPGPLASCCFSPDGRKLALLVHDERAVRLWHLDRLRTRLARLGLDW